LNNKTLFGGFFVVLVQKFDLQKPTYKPFSQGSPYQHPNFTQNRSMGLKSAFLSLCLLSIFTLLSSQKTLDTHRVST